MEMVRDAGSWFEIPVSDFEYAKKFYDRNFANVRDTNGKISNGVFYCMSKNKEELAGLLSSVKDIATNNGVLIFLNAGKDLNTILSRIEPVGENVPKTQITSELGCFAVFIDSEQYKLALLSME